MLEAAQILHLHDAANARGHDSALPPPAVSSPLHQLVLDQHQANFDLWHQEDQARAPEATDHTISEIKHAIDRLNQQRNDLAEKIDVTLLQAAGPQNPDAPLHSETPGLIIDRLSILSLKVFHTAEETRRPDASIEHHERNRLRLALLDEQRNDLAACLDILWSDITAGRRRFKLYRQLKMYNDPTLNPVLYTRRPAAG